MHPYTYFSHQGFIIHIYVHTLKFSSYRFVCQSQVDVSLNWLQIIIISNCLMRKKEIIETNNTFYPFLGGKRASSKHYILVSLQLCLCNVSSSLEQSYSLTFCKTLIRSAFAVQYLKNICNCSGVYGLHR